MRNTVLVLFYVHRTILCWKLFYSSVYKIRIIWLSKLKNAHSFLLLYFAVGSVFAISHRILNNSFSVIDINCHNLYNRKKGNHLGVYVLLTFTITGLQLNKKPEKLTVSILKIITLPVTNKTWFCGHTENKEIQILEVCGQWTFRSGRFRSKSDRP